MRKENVFMVCASGTSSVSAIQPANSGVINCLTYLSGGTDKKGSVKIQNGSDVVWQTPVASGVAFHYPFSNGDIVSGKNKAITAVIAGYSEAMINIGGFTLE